MGQKVHPRGLRLGIIRDWDARWYADKKQFSKLLHEDITIRDHIKRKMYPAGISRVEVERAANRLKLTIYTGRPGMVIGRGGAGVEELRREIERMTDKQVAINIVEVRVPELDAQLVAENVAAQLEKRISFRRAMKQAVSRTMKLGARGVKVICSGRLGGAEIARRERYVDGTVPLHTLRADIDYGMAEAATTYGRIGVKVWIHAPTMPRREGGRERPGYGERGPGRAGERGGERADRGPGRADRGPGRAERGPGRASERGPERAAEKAPAGGAGGG